MSECVERLAVFCVSLPEVASERVSERDARALERGEERESVIIGGEESARVRAYERACVRALCTRVFPPPYAFRSVCRILHRACPPPGLDTAVASALALLRPLSCTHVHTRAGAIERARARIPAHVTRTRQQHDVEA